MGHQSNATPRINLDAVPMHASDEQFHVRISNVHEDHVRLSRCSLIAQRTQALLQQFCVKVILCEPLDVVLQGIQSGRCQYAGLAHSATGDLAPSSRLPDKLRTPQQNRTSWSPEPLGKTD